MDYNLQTTIPGLHALGEANFSDHGANRLGASALMQGLADGYFIIPYTLGNFLATHKLPEVTAEDKAFQDSRAQVKERLDKLLSVDGKQSVDDFHRRLGRLMWEHVGMSRSSQGLKEAANHIHNLREEFWADVKVAGDKNYKNSEVEKAGRVADFLELGELMAKDGLDREESCGGHFREEHQTPENEAKRDDEKFCHVSAWEATSNGNSIDWRKHVESLQFEYVKLSTRSYK